MVKKRASEVPPTAVWCRRLHTRASSKNCARAGSAVSENDRSSMLRWRWLNCVSESKKR
jgi:hypothetical protein